MAFTVPLIAPGAPGLTKRITGPWIETPQLDTDTTHTSKIECAGECGFARMCYPGQMIYAPLGAVHSYDVTPATGEMVYVTTAMFWPGLLQILVGPNRASIAGNTF